MAREAMADLLARLRRMVGDPAGESAAWTDDELQDWLDARRQDVRGAELMPDETVGPGGVVRVLDYYARGGRGDWEADAELRDAGGGVLAPAEADCLVGHWRFDTHTPPPVLLTGRTYDLCAAAADVLEAWAARTKQEYDFGAADQRLARSQQTAAMRGLAQGYRARQRPVVGRVVRGDV